MPAPVRVTGQWWVAVDSAADLSGLSPLIYVGCAASAAILNSKRVVGRSYRNANQILIRGSLIRLE